MRTCPHCGRSVSDKSTFCPGCGRGVPKTDSTIKPEKHGKRPWLWCLASLLAVMLVMGLVWTFQPHPGDPASEFFSYQKTWLTPASIASDLTVTAHTEKENLNFFLDRAALTLRLESDGENALVNGLMTLEDEALLSLNLSYADGQMHIQLPDVSETVYMFRPEPLGDLTEAVQNGTVTKTETQDGGVIYVCTAEREGESLTWTLTVSEEQVRQIHLEQGENSLTCDLDQGKRSNLGLPSGVYTLTRNGMTIRLTMTEAADGWNYTLTKDGGLSVDIHASNTGTAAPFTGPEEAWSDAERDSLIQKAGEQLKKALERKLYGP